MLSFKSETRQMHRWLTGRTCHAAMTVPVGVAMTRSRVSRIGHAWRAADLAAAASASISSAAATTGLCRIQMEAIQ